jgi:hypothetical protein
MAEEDDGLEPIKTEPIWSTDEPGEADDSILGIDTDTEYRGGGRQSSGDESA